MKHWILISCLLVTTIGASSLLESCRKKDINRFVGTPLTLTIPAGFPEPAYDFKNNPLSQEGVALGRQLFHDGILSKDGNFPCASCHQQIAAFTTYDHDLSHGYNHSHTTRNAPGLANLAWQTAFRQDGSASTIEEVSKAHITSIIDMGESIEGVLAKLRQDTKYKPLFRAVYGDETINEDRMLKAITQFVLTMVSADSKYDRVKAGQASFTAAEQSGYQVFQAKCATCHTEPLFTDFSYRNIGLPVLGFLSDYGRMRVTNNPADSLKFRVPSLRNVDLTAYYTHDGRSGALRHMVEHYRSRVVQSPTVDPLVKNGIALTNTELDNVLAFLRTLSDENFIKDPKFAAP